MVAITLAPVPSLPPSVVVPPTTLGRGRRRSRARRPSASALLVVVVLAAVLWLAFGSSVGGRQATGAVTGSSTYTVGIDDTWWSIARSVAPAGETAIVVERLIAANRGVELEPGVEVVVPGG